jgi:hypothetical protein
VRLVVMRKGGGGKVAVNPGLVTHVRSANGAFTDIFFDGQQVAVGGTFEEVVRQLTAPERRESPLPNLRASDHSLVLPRIERRRRAQPERELSAKGFPPIALKRSMAASSRS